MSSEQQQRIMGYFIEEAKDHLNTIEQGLLNLQSTIEDPELISEVFRAAHSVKGGAAMLGIDSVQQMAHRLEDCFKLLKEHPVQVDQRLETLFLEVFDALKALIEQLQSPFGLTDKSADQIVTAVTPVVSQLQRHLDQMLQLGPEPAGSIHAAAGGPSLPLANMNAGTPLSPAIQRFFQAEVPEQLRRMLQLFKHQDSDEGRSQLDQCCQQLLATGSAGEVPVEWWQIVEHVRRAIACPTNSYRQLAPVVIKNLKRAQENIVAGQFHAVEVSDDLEALLPLAAEDQGLDALLADTAAPDEAVLDENLGDPFTDQASSADMYADVALAELDALTSSESGAVEADDLSDLFEQDLFDQDRVNRFGNDIPEPDLAEDEDLAFLRELDAPDAPSSGTDDSSNYDDAADSITADLDDLSTLLTEADNEVSEADSLVSALADTADSDLDELFDDLPDIEEASAAESTDLAALFAEDDSSPRDAVESDAAEPTSEQQESDLLDDLFSAEANDLEPTSAAQMDEPGYDASDAEALESLPMDALETAEGGETPSAIDQGLEAEESDLERDVADIADIAEAADGAIDGDLGFDVSSVDVTEDVWAGEDDENWLDAISFDEESGNIDENPFAQTGTELDDIGLDENLAETQDDTLDQLFDNLESPPDVFPEPDHNVDSGDVEASLDSLETDIPQSSDDLFEGNVEENPEEVTADPSELDATGLDAAQIDELFSDFSSSSAADNPEDSTSFDLADVMTTDVEAANLDRGTGDSGFPEGDRGSERLEDWDTSFEASGSSDPFDLMDLQELGQDSAPDVDPATVSDFDDLLSIGNLETAELPELDSTADEGMQSDPLLDGANEERHRADDMADLFLDLDNLLGDADADVQADLLDVDSNQASSGPSLAAAGNEPLYDFSPTVDIVRSDTGPDAESDEIEAAIQDLEDVDADEPLSLNQPDETPQVSDDFADLEKLLEQADETLGGAPMPSTALRLTSPNRRPVRRPTLGNQTMRVSVKNLDNLNNLVGELVVNRNSLEQSQDRLRQFLDNLMSQVQQLGDLGQRMRDLYERSLLESSLRSSRPQQFPVASTEADSHHVTGARFDALEMDRFTGFHSLSQEIIELIVRVREAASDIDFIVDESDQGTRMLRQITTQLQEGINHTRMVPFAQAADRLPRAVRDISIKFDKQAELVVEGRDTLIDKMILEQLYDPMTHLVNNAITHGIELPEARVAAGKSPVGKITVRAFHQGNQTIISVTDDGAGIDAQTVKQKALQRGLISPQEAEIMSQHDIYDLLFRHGFSTRDQADDFAGRGVGMDVVRTSLSEVRGAVNIDSTVGQGTTFTIRLPLTLSISKALLCVSDRARIAFPMDGVEDMFDIAQDRIQQNEVGQSCIPWRERLLPFRPLSRLLKFNRTISRGSVYGGRQDDDMISIVVLRSAGTYLALQVDQVLEEREIVIKQLEPPVPKPAGIAGATVLGDGRVMPIIDVLELVDLALGRSRRDMVQEEEPPIEPETSEAREPTVLIVDDSITVRELLSMTFAKVGYRVEQARDGQEAWEKLKSGLPCDLVFCDIEMPRMDGLELLSRLQRDPELGDLPVAMLTSRGADRHRQMAVELGAKGYFTKPYLEEALLEAAQQILTGEALVASD